jgi:REP element-mobilizing transposase RayT
LVNALPGQVLAAYLGEKDLLDKQIEATRSDQVRDALAREAVRLYCRQIDRCLDVGLGDCWLREPKVATLVAGALNHFNGDRYDLFAWSIMPNHVHVVFRPLGEEGLAPILHSWKSYTGTRANRILRRSGPFWQKEYFDHLVRSDEDLWRFCRYVRDNPVKGGLRDWPWVWVTPEVSAARDGGATSAGDASRMEAPQ